MPVTAVRVRVLKGAMQMPGIELPITSGHTFLTSKEHAETIIALRPGHYEIVKEIPERDPVPAESPKPPKKPTTKTEE